MMFKETAFGRSTTQLYILKEKEIHKKRRTPKDKFSYFQGTFIFGFPHIFKNYP